MSYLEDRGYTSLSQICNGDITVFIVLVCQEHYAPTSLGSHITGLRRFASLFPEMEGYAAEIPENLLKKQDITSVYTEEEHKRINQYLMESGMSERNRAISLIAFETGLRAVDICKLELSDIDWKHDTIHIRQKKTGKALAIPIRPALGNALATYLLEERPPSDSTYVFLRSVAPYHPLTDHSGIYNILRQVLAEAGVEPDGRISGTRMARHSYASRMLRNGVPLPVISEALGHSSPNYIYDTQAYYLAGYVSFVEMNYPGSPLSREAADSYLASLADRAGNLYGTVCALREFGRYLLRQGIDTYVLPAKTVRQPVPEPPYFFTEQEIEIFFTAVDSIRPYAGYQGRELIIPAFFRLMYCCGTRCREARLLRRENVSITDRYIDILQSKGPKSRRLYISGELADYLGAYDSRIALLYPDREYFFPGYRGHSYVGEGFVAGNFRKAWAKVFPDFPKV